VTLDGPAFVLDLDASNYPNPQEPAMRSRALPPSQTFINEAGPEFFG
jgi:hypothetical protein